MSVKKAIIILATIGLLGAAGVFYAASNEKKSQYVTEKIKRGDLVQTVSETGAVKSENEINLSFSAAGKIEKIPVSVGDNVAKGDTLVELEHDKLMIKKREAEASVAMAGEELNKLLAGAEDKDIKVAKAGVKQAKKAYEAAKDELEKTRESVNENIAQAESEVHDLESDAADNVTTYEQAIKTAEKNLKNTKRTYQKNVDNFKEKAWIASDKAESIANNALDQINSILDDDDLDHKLSAQDSSYLAATKKAHSNAKEALGKATAYMQTRKQDYNGEEALILLKKMENVLDITFTSLQNCYQALEHSITGSGFTQTELEAYKSKVSTQQSGVSGSQSSIQSTKQGLEDALITYDTKVSAAEQSLAEARSAYDDALKQARNALARAKKEGDKLLAQAKAKAENAHESWQVARAELDRLLAPAGQHDIELARAKVRKAQASLESIKQKIEDSKLKAPIKGTVTKKFYEPGEQVSPGKPVVAMLEQNEFEIEVLISEADIAKVNKDDTAKITLDAFGYDREFAGKVEFIDPAETKVQDVIYYKVKVLFQNKAKIRQAGIKPGMTANVTIVTAKKQNVLLAPMRSIIERNGDGRVIRVLGPDGNLAEKPIRTGLRGDAGNVEILEGPQAGTRVVTYIEEEE